MLTKTQYDNLVGKQNNVVIEVSYNPSEEWSQRFRMSIWELGIWKEGRFFITTLVVIFKDMWHVYKILKLYKDTDLEHPWSHYKEYFQKRDRNSRIKFGWAFKGRPWWKSLKSAKNVMSSK